MLSPALLRTAFALLAAALAPLSAQEARLGNLSTRAQVGTDASQIFAGFVIGPGANRTVLIRAVGPTLATVSTLGTLVLANPRLTLSNSDNSVQIDNDDWGTPLAGATTVTAANFSALGAFALPANSRDSALIATLPPGSYNVQVGGVGGTSGIAIIELYEVGATPGSTRLANISSRAVVGTDASVMIPGIVISPGTGTRRLLIRALGPALTALGVVGALADPTITLTNPTNTVTFASNDNWGTPTGINAASAASLAIAFANFTGFPFPDGSRDSAVLVDLPAGSYTVQVSGVGNTTGIAVVEVYDLTPGAQPAVAVTASKPTSDESGTNPGEFTFTRSGDTLSALTVAYTVGGSAINGFDYPFLPGTVTFASGVSTVRVPLSPNPDVQIEGTDTVVITISAGTGYTASTANATVSITDSASTLYIASIRPTTTASGGSTASGTATIQLSSSGTLAAVTVAFSNLSSAQTNAYLVLGPNEDFVFALPLSQVSGVQWTFAPTASYSSAALISALRSGGISVRLDSARYPNGEVKGSFIVSSGTRIFSPPAAPPAVALSAVTATDAARLLTQATFGPKKSEIDALTGGSIDTWLTAQLALPFTSHRTATVFDRTTYGGSGSFTNWNAIHPPNRQSAWFRTVLTAPDQLRQRVAFALSQILVVSDISLGGDNYAEPLANYYDILGNGAFGNFRTLLENVTLSPIMAEYLSSLRNAKATFNPDGAVLTTPDENYAREVMQLFTIGLEQLQPDGTYALDASGLPVPTYDQTTITEMAKVFTGWAYPSANPNAFRTAGSNFYSPLQLFPAFHDDTVKNLSPVSATPIPAGQGGITDLRLALDALFTHPNTPPFISKLLIQRLVTSNPSPAYVYRVAQRFADNGSGLRGDLAAVVRAILTDFEARSPTVSANPTYGKLEEPLLRFTGLLRTFNASSASGRFLGYQNTVDGVPITSATPRPALASQINISPNAFSVTRPDNALGSLSQAPLRSPSVFNFYSPDYVLPGPLAAAGLVAPEFEITDDNFAISAPNYLRNFVNAVTPTTAGVPTPAAPYVLLLNLDFELTLVNNPAALLDHLSLVLTANSLSTATRTRITSALAALPVSATAADRVRTAILLIATTQSAAVQK